MGRQINFYLHPDDYLDFEDMLKTTGDIIFLPYYHHDNKVSIVDSTIPIDQSKEGSRIYVVRKQDLTQMELWHIEKFGYWLIKDNRLPLLHYDRCNFINGKLTRGRLYFQPSFATDIRMINKPEDFVSWADKVIKKARRMLKKHTFDAGGWSFSEYIGQYANEWIDKTKKEKQVNSSELISW